MQIRKEQSGKIDKKSRGLRKKEMNVHPQNIFKLPMIKLIELAS
jgi:hypothetical protein